MELYERFANLLSNYTENTDLVGSLWNDINIHYTEKHRNYHNLQHLEELFTHFDMYVSNVNRPNILTFSIFYHDIIYSVWNKNNEEKSADFAIKKLSNIIDDVALSEIQQQIIATKTHEAIHSDTKWLLDFDLAILGGSSEAYMKYRMLIREEYKAIPNFIYKKGRKKVLQHFIKKPSIFATEEFKLLYETRAKENLTNELKSL